MQIFNSLATVAMDATVQKGKIIQHKESVMTNKVLTGRHEDKLVSRKMVLDKKATTEQFSVVRLRSCHYV